MWNGDISSQHTNQLCGPVVSVTATKIKLDEIVSMSRRQELIQHIAVVQNVLNLSSRLILFESGTD